VHLTVVELTQSLAAEQAPVLRPLLGSVNVLHTSVVPQAFFD